MHRGKLLQFGVLLFAALTSALLSCCALRAVADEPVAPRPLITNGDFEDRAAADTRRPTGWYYVQQGALVKDEQAPSGQHFMRFQNAVPGRVAIAQQHARVDGRETRAIDVSVRVALRDVAPGQSLAERPAVHIYFYDADDAEIGQQRLGPWAGTMAWSQEATRLEVPEQARLLLVVIGLGGATGTAEFDELQVVPAPHNASVLPRRIGK